MQTRSLKYAFLLALILTGTGTPAICRYRLPGDAPRSSADSASVTDKPGNNILETVVVTGQYAAGSTGKAVHKIRVIDRKKIDAMNAQNLRDVLSNEMNIRLSQDNALGSSMSLQGVSGENVKILIDDIPVIGRQNGNIDLSQINLNNIERIEIVEGPMSVNYGTNALAGTINLITRKGQKDRYETGATAYYESIGTYNINARLGYSDKHHTLQISGGRNYFDGWSEGEPFSLYREAASAGENRYQQWKPREQYFADIQYLYRWNKTTLNYKGSLFRETIVNRGMPRSPYGENAIDDRYRTARTDHAIYVNSRPGKGKSVNAFVSFNDYRRTRNTFFRDLTTLSSELTGNEGDQDTSGFRLFSSRGSFSSSGESKISYQVGYDIGVEQASGPRIREKEQQIGDYALFTSLEYKPVPELTIRPGVRLAYNTNYKAPVIPSLNVRFRLSDALTLRGSYARGFRSPTLKELYFYFVDINHNIRGNGDLKAEHSDNYSLNISYAKMFGERLLKMDAGLYYNDIRNMISLAQVTGAEYSYANIGVFKTMGVQLSSELKISRLSMSAGVAYTGRYNQLSETSDADRFSYSPEIRSSLLYELMKQKITIAIFYKYTGRTPGYSLDAANEIVATCINDYSIADLSVSKLLCSGKINLAAGCKNLFDVRNINSFTGASASASVHSSGSNSVPLSTGRNYFLKLEINLHTNQL